MTLLCDRCAFLAIDDFELDLHIENNHHNDSTDLKNIAKEDKYSLNITRFIKGHASQATLERCL